MAGLKDGDDYAEGEVFKAPFLLKYGLLLLGLVAGGIFFALALSTDKGPSMAYSWLFAIIFFLSLGVGGTFWVLLHNVSNSGWGVVVRRLMENLAFVIPAVMLISLPLLFPTFRDHLWEWFPKREAALEHASVEAAEKAPKELKAKKEKIAKAEAAVAQSKQALAEMENATPGNRAFLTRRLAAEEAALAKLLAEDISLEAVEAKLKSKAYHHKEALLYKKEGYLNPPFWYWRFVYYFVALAGIAFAVRYWSYRCDKDGDPKWFRISRRWSCGFLIFYATSWTFLVFDWLMALNYTWFSTMWGVYLFAGAALNSMSFLIILVTVLRKAGYLKKVITMEHYHILGKLMLAFTIFWAYIAFSQFFLIWYANITEETIFYLTRNSDFWNIYTIVFLVVGHFFVPFVLLLTQWIKKKPALLSLVAGWNLLMHIFDVYWIIIPERGPSITAAAKQDVLMTIPGAWVYDVLAFVAVGGIFGFMLLRNLGAVSIFPCRDPRLDESLNLVN
ncbi:MAG: hypothetical protein AAF357_00800 [Verrucomicrobiota bacterium]